jgi:hypothetical protein
VQDDGEEARGWELIAYLSVGHSLVQTRGPWPMPLFKLHRAMNDIDGNKYCLRILEHFEGSHSYENRFSEASNNKT